MCLLNGTLRGESVRFAHGLRLLFRQILSTVLSFRVNKIKCKTGSFFKGQLYERVQQTNRLVYNQWWQDVTRHWFRKVMDFITDSSFLTLGEPSSQLKFVLIDRRHLHWSKVKHHHHVQNCKAGWRSLWTVRNTTLAHAMHLRRICTCVENSPRFQLVWNKLRKPRLNGVKSKFTSIDLYTRKQPW